MREIDVQEAFLEAGYQISPEAVHLILSNSSPGELVSYVLEHVDESVFVIEAEHIDVHSFKPKCETTLKDKFISFPGASPVISSGASPLFSAETPTAATQLADP
ncbi:MAG: hypothetical protein ACQESU_02780, partial [Halobacteriota archaeon]